MKKNRKFKKKKILINEKTCHFKIFRLKFSNEKFLSNINRMCYYQFLLGSIKYQDFVDLYRLFVALFVNCNNIRHDISVQG